MKFLKNFLKNLLFLIAISCFVVAVVACFDAILESGRLYWDAKVTACVCFTLTFFIGFLLWKNNYFKRY